MDAVVIPAVLGIGLAYAVAPAVAVQLAAAAKPRRVQCPDNGQEALVKLSLPHAAKTAFTGGAQEVTGCSRWPEKAGCDHACMAGVHV